MNKAKCLIVGVVCLMAVVSSFWPVGAAPVNPLPPLRMQGVTMVRSDGTRFIVAGLNIEAYRDYDQGCGWASDGFWDTRVMMTQKIKALNVNIVRLNYSYRFLNTAQNFNRFMDIAEAFANQNIYVMPSDHTYTGDVLSSASASYPMMKKILDNATARGIINYVVANPWNEPGPDMAVSAWVTAQKGVLTYLRKTALFNGVVVLDGSGWSTLLDVPAFKQVMAHDATLVSSGANVVFSNHLYPNITDLPSKIWTAANQVPLVIGELGQENPGASPLRPQYVKDVIASELNAGIAAGHNGLFAWIWNWCDINTLLDDWEDESVPYTNASSLTTHGVLWRDFYYSKLPNAPIVQPTPSRTPTRTVLPTNTPRPPIGATVTPVPSCDATVEQTGRFNGRDATFSTCIRYAR